MARSDYRLRPCIKYGINKELKFILPTIIYIPWRTRHVNMSAFEFVWFGFFIGFGNWESK